MQDPTDLLATYVAMHNRGVSSSDFADLIALFAEDARMEFRGFPVDLPAIDGRDAIAAAFRSHPPNDLLMISDVTPTERESVTARYAWKLDPERQEGSLTLAARDGLIARLLIVHD